MHPDSDETTDARDETADQQSWLAEQVQLITLEDGFGV